MSETKKTGDFYIQLTTREYFETVEERDHYVKEHFEISFDDKVALLGEGVVEHFNDDKNILATIELKKVRGTE
jgi:hypothetical protein